MREELLERDGELARIGQAMAAVQSGYGGLLVIQGPAGIGKSALLRALHEHSTRARLQILAAQASELERDFAFGVVRQLLETRIVRAAESERADLLAGAAGLAAPVLGLGGGGVGDPFATLHGLYWLVANLAAIAPVVLSVDDLQWADDRSLRWLVYLCNRLEGCPCWLRPRPARRVPDTLSYWQSCLRFEARRFCVPVRSTSLRWPGCYVRGWAPAQTRPSSLRARRLPEVIRLRSAG